jgi:uncharacterized protein (DUF2147 family)
MKKSIASLGWFAVAIAGLVLPVRAEPPAGTWLTEDATTQVRFAPCGDRICGRIAWLRNPVDPETGKPWLDKRNPDESARRAPLIGLTLMKGFKETAAGGWEGELYNPRDGKTYTGTLRSIGAGKMELRGCTFAGLLCQSKTWTRIGP